MSRDFQDEVEPRLKPDAKVASERRSASVQAGPEHSSAPSGSQRRAIRPAPKAAASSSRAHEKLSETGRLGESITPPKRRWGFQMLRPGHDCP